mgnify:CR=1 FL=1
MPIAMKTLIITFFLSLLTGNKLFLLLISVLAIDVAFNMVVEAKIMEEDSEIEKDFPDLYMLLYSRLVRGTQVRLAPTLDEYIKSLEVIYGDKSLDKESLRVLNTEAPYVADRLYTLKTQIWNEAMTYLGISNLNIQKKERLVANEANVSQGGTLASRSSRLEMRKRACDEINRMFGLNIDVEYNKDLDISTGDGDTSENEESEGFDNE